MPLGTFLDSMPALLFIAAHVLFLGVAIWAVRAASAPFFWLYAVSQLIFLAFFGRVITMKMAVLIEQTLIVVMVAMMTMKGAVRAGR
jgi:uncharacterized membrane protein